MLLYPKTAYTPEPWGTYLKGKEYAHHSKLGFIDVVDPAGENLNLNIGEEIFLKVAELL